MKYLAIYLVIGVVALGVVLVQDFLERKKDPKLGALELLASAQRRRRPLARFMEGVVVPVLAGLLVIAAWPVLVPMAAKRIFARRAAAPDDRQGAPLIAEDDLGERLTVAEIEEREQVVDPQDAVPALPFGHLNAVWVAFRDELAEDDQLWSFTVSRDAGWQKTETKEGYVAMRDGRAGPFFVARRILTRTED